MRTIESVIGIGVSLIIGAVALVQLWLLYGWRLRLWYWDWSTRNRERNAWLRWMRCLWRAPATLEGAE